MKKTAKEELYGIVHFYQSEEGVCKERFGVYSTSDSGNDLALLLSTAREAENIGKPSIDPSSFEIAFHNGTIYRGVFYQQGIALSAIQPGKQEGKAILLEVDGEKYQDLLSSVKNLFTIRKNQFGLAEVNAYYPTELARLRFSICDSIEMTTADGKIRGVFTQKSPDLTKNAFDKLRSFYVMPDSRMNVDKATTLSDAVTARMEFMDGTACNLQCDGKMLIYCFDGAKEAVQFKLKNYIVNELEQRAAGVFIPETGKPVIYLYPEQPTDVTVKVDCKGQFTYTYPTYNNGWQVTAYPDGRLVNKADGSEHYYLFWKGNAGANWRFDEGFVVKGEDTERFLINALKTMGLTPREYNDFIVYWLPEMQHNPYNLITFATDEYEQLAPLTVTPKPDSILRVHMVYRALNEPVEIKEQKLTPFERKGFTVVEWGGTRG